MLGLFLILSQVHEILGILSDRAQRTEACRLIGRILHTAMHENRRNKAIVLERCRIRISIQRLYIASRLTLSKRQYKNVHFYQPFDLAQLS